MTHYPMVKNEENRLLAFKNFKEYGWFTFKHWKGNWAIIKAFFIPNGEIEVWYMHEDELSGEFFDSCSCHRFKVINDSLTSLKDDVCDILSNKERYVMLINDQLNLNIKLDSEDNFKYICDMKKEKYYVVPAEVIESNFPDDPDKLIETCAVFETDKSITEIAELLIKD